jgi:hypothetical protein
MDGFQEFEIGSYKDYQWPTGTIYVPHYYHQNKIVFYKPMMPPQNATFSLNPFQTKITRFCVINLLFIRDENIFQKTAEFDYRWYTYMKTLSLYLTIAYRYFIKLNNHDWRQELHKNIYTLFITQADNIVEKYKFKLYTDRVTFLLVENFALVSLAQDKEIKICVGKQIPPRSFLEDDANCEKLSQLQESVIEIIWSSYKVYTKYWFSPGPSIEAESNPFNRFSNKSIDQYLFKEIGQRKNVTVIKNLERCANCAPVSYFALFQTSLNSSLNFWTANMFTRWSGYKFLTCYTKTYIGFGFYLSPFQLDLWIGFLITMVTVVGVSWIYVKFYFKESTSISFSPWLFVLGTFFEETSSAPASLEKKTFYRLSIGIWCLMVATLTSCYNSLMITGLNSPLPGTQILSFPDLLCDRSLVDAKQDIAMAGDNEI